ncbi:hypothetical protein [Fodinibius sp. SL11]|uniref:hypothetical protein n=1 Tax=Fodinibius sp. SL11 TaxID=3425690 RepID=UPI003F8806DD
MNAGLITSFIVAGILMVSIINMNTSVVNSSSELTMTQFTRERMASISRMISEDIQKMGYNRTGKTDPILQVANSHKIKFHSNIDNSTDNSVEVITWEFRKDLEITSSKNQNDRVLHRIVKNEDGSEEVTEIKLGVTEFKIGYYTTYGGSISEDSLSTPVDGSLYDDLKQFYIKLKVESPEKIVMGSKGEGRYITSVWEKRFSPPNLEETAENNN